MPLKRLAALTALDLFLVVLIGFIVVVVQAALTSPSATWGTLRALKAVGVPLEKLGLQDRLERAMVWRFYVGAECVALPPDDSALNEWLKPLKLDDVRLQREHHPEPRQQGEIARVLIHYSGADNARRVEPPWETLGYRLGRPEPSVWWYRNSPDTNYTPADPQLVLIVFACLLAGQFLVGIVRLWRDRKNAAKMQVAEGPGVLLGGLGIGLLLGVIYWGAYQAALHWGGPTLALAPPWQALPISGVDMVRSGIPPILRSVEPHPFLLLVLFLAVFAFPVAQNVFVWSQYSRWARAGWKKTGAVVAAAIASLFLLSVLAYPVMIVAGLVLLWLGSRAGSPGPALVALVVLAMIVTAISFGAIPSLPHPVNQLPGKWTEIGNTTPTMVGGGWVDSSNHVQFLHGGGADGSFFRDQGGLQAIYRRPWHYEWTGPATIRLTWRKETDDFPATTITHEWLREDYRVLVSWDHLTLTRMGDGKELKFRRTVE